MTYFCFEEVTHKPSMAIHPFKYCLLMLVFPQAILTQDLDIAYSGNYLIRNCNAGKPGSYAEQLQNLLPQIHNTLQDVIADAFLGTTSSHGFATFFRSNDNIAYVHRLYRLISQGPSVPLPERDVGIPMPRFTSGQPTIICVQPNDESDDHHGDIEWLLTQCALDETHFFSPVWWRERKAIATSCRVRASGTRPS